MCEGIRALDPQVPIILTTASMDTDLLVGAINLGISAFLHKPVDLQGVARSVTLATEALERRHLQRKTVEQELALLNFREKYHETQQEQAFRKELSILENDLLARAWKGPGDSEWTGRVIYQPHDIMCGDSYSLRRLPDGSLLIFLADAMGKGLAPSLTTLLGAYLFNLEVDALPEGSLPDFGDFLKAYASKIQKRLLEDEIFCFVLARLAKSAPILDFAAFGMPPMLLKEDGGLRKVRGTNPPLSAYLTTFAWDRQDVAGVRGLLLCTDGLNEAALEDGRLYRDHLGQDFLHSPCARRLWARFQGRVPQPEDDVTFLMLSRTDAPPVKEVRLEMPCRQEAVEGAWEELESQLAAWGLPDPEGWGCFSLALREALLNAYEHGALDLTAEEKLNLFDDPGAEWLKRREEAAKGSISISLALEEADGHWRLRAVVRDPGKGFDPRPVLLGTPDAVSASGRGLRLMNKYCDALFFNGPGNEATLLRFILREPPCS